MIPTIFIWVFFILSFIQMVGVYAKIPYDKLINPIFIFTPFYIALFILTRLGALTEIKPSFVNNQDGIIGATWMDVVGYFPELLILIEILLCLLIDWIFVRFVDKRIEKFIVDYSFSEEFQQLDK